MIVCRCRYIIIWDRDFFVFNLRKEVASKLFKTFDIVTANDTELHDVRRVPFLMETKK